MSWFYFCYHDKHSDKNNKNSSLWHIIPGYSLSLPEQSQQQVLRQQSCHIHDQEVHVTSMVKKRDELTYMCLCLSSLCSLTKPRAQPTSSHHNHNNQDNFPEASQPNLSWRLSCQVILDCVKMTAETSHHGPNH